MKPNELRVGNWVNNNEEDYQITSATISQLERVDSTAKPIELTPEWAKRLGFEIVGGGISYDKDKLCLYFGDSILSGKNGRTYFNSWAILEHTPKYVHELQNLYYALTGVELSAS